MAYLDDMALEREKSKQAMLEGKTPLLGADTSAQLHALGVNLGLVPPGTPPSALTQMMADLLKGPGKVKVDEAKPLQVQPLVGKLASLPADPRVSDDSTGNTIANAFSGAKDSALQQILKNQRNQPPVPSGSSASTTPGDAKGAGRNRLMSRAPRAAEGPGYQADVAFLNDRGGHYSVLKDGKIVSVPMTTQGSYGNIDPELAARLRSAGEAFEKANPGKKAQYGEFSRGEDVQKIYRDKYESGQGGIAARPGQSRHQSGAAGDIPSGEFRNWLNQNKDAHGVHFPVKGDAPHVEVNRANTQSFATPGGAPMPAQPAVTGPRPALKPTADASGNPVLAEQRKPIADFFDKNPTAKEAMAAAAYTEDNNTSEGRIAVHEAGANRITASGRPVKDIIDPKYYAAMSDPKLRPRYEAALQKIRNDPQLRAQLYSEIDQAHKNGTNYAKMGTDFASGDTAAKSRTNSTATAKVGGNEFFIKDKNPETHGAGTVAANQKWKASTDAAMAQPAAAPTAPPQDTPQATPQVAPAPADVPAPVASAPAAAAPTPPAIAPPATAAAKPAPQVNPAHALLDTKIIDLVKQGAPDKVGQIPAAIAGKTLREAMSTPLIGGAITAKAKEYLGASGVTPEQFDQAVKEGAPKPAAPGKRSALEGLPQYAQADTGTMSDALPEQQPTVEAAGAAAPTQEVTAPAPGTPSEAPAVGPEAPSEPPPAPDTPAPAPAPAAQPGTMTPEMAQAFTAAFKDQPPEGPATPPPADAMPVLPTQPDPSPVKTGAGGLSLAPPGLGAIPTGGVAPTLPGSQGGSIAMAGMLPPIQNATFSTPLIDQQAAQNSAFGTSNLSPIPWQTLGSWGWGGGNIGAGFDWGGGGGQNFDFAGGFTPPTIG